MWGEVCIGKVYVAILLAVLLALGIASYDARTIGPRNGACAQACVNNFNQAAPRVPRESAAEGTTGTVVPIRLVRDVLPISTQGLSQYRQIGLLIGEEEGENKVLKLIGRQQYPGSSRYDYYTVLSAGNSNVEIPMPNRKELYDNDTVTLSELGKDYTVKVYKYDDLRYHPSIYSSVFRY